MQDAVSDYEYNKESISDIIEKLERIYHDKEKIRVDEVVELRDQASVLLEEQQLLLNTIFPRNGK